MSDNHPADLWPRNLPRPLPPRVTRGSSFRSRRMRGPDASKTGVAYADEFARDLEKVGEHMAAQVLNEDGTPAPTVTLSTHEMVTLIAVARALEDGRGELAPEARDQLEQVVPATAATRLKG